MTRDGRARTRVMAQAKANEPAAPILLELRALLVEPPAVDLDQRRRATDVRDADVAHAALLLGDRHAAARRTSTSHQRLV